MYIYLPVTYHLHFSYIRMFVMTSHYDFHFPFSKTKDIEHIFMCLFITFIFLLATYPLKSFAQFSILIEYFVSLFSCKKPLTDVCFAYAFFQSRTCLCIFQSLSMSKSFNKNEVQYIIIIFMVYGVVPKKSSHNPGSQTYSPMFLVESYGFSLDFEP